jgi:hypothetical protein
MPILNIRTDAELEQPTKAHADCSCCQKKIANLRCSPFTTHFQAINSILHSITYELAIR